MKLEEWYKQATRGTSGDMVFSILADWKADVATLTLQIKELEQEMSGLREKADFLTLR